MRHPFAAAALLLFVASTGRAQPPPPLAARAIPDFKLTIIATPLEDFQSRLLAYVQLRERLEAGLPPLAVTDNPADIERAVGALARRIAAARAKALEGDIFTPAVQTEITKLLAVEVHPAVWAAIMEDNPGEFEVRVGGSYPRDKPHSTVPPNVLARLPDLPDGLQYRFLGRHLVLYDTRANVVLDRIAYAIRCAACPRQRD